MPLAPRALTIPPPRPYLNLIFPHLDFPRPPTSPNAITSPFPTSSSLWRFAYFRASAPTSTTSLHAFYPATSSPRMYANSIPALVLITTSVLDDSSIPTSIAVKSGARAGEAGVCEGGVVEAGESRKNAGRRLDVGRSEGNGMFMVETKFEWKEAVGAHRVSHIRLPPSHRLSPHSPPRPRVEYFRLDRDLDLHIFYLAPSSPHTPASLLALARASQSKRRKGTGSGSAFIPCGTSGFVGAAGGGALAVDRTMRGGMREVVEGRENAGRVELPEAWIPGKARRQEGGWIRAGRALPSKVTPELIDLQLYPHRHLELRYPGVTASEGSGAVGEEGPGDNRCKPAWRRASVEVCRTEDERGGKTSRMEKEFIDERRASGSGYAMRRQERFPSKESPDLQEFFERSRIEEASSIVIIYVVEACNVEDEILLGKRLIECIR
ncbi:hypothetical protein R3P38DRAFT_3362589 [Favolaschia claudopus]|uniref:Uncharacterized protein n=1 Tax=Favolaschia claudopus TaxID=2862362 RepID=A0AAW0AMB9_9AGAR